MDSVFIDHQQEGSAELPALSHYDTRLLSILKQAVQSAARLQRPVLASLTLPAPHHDSLHLFHTVPALHLGERLYWEQPSEQKAFVGIGSATQLTPDGPELIAQAASSWHTLQMDAVLDSVPATIDGPISGPLLFGGFAFDPQRPASELWDGFPAGLLILPRLLVSTASNGATITLSQLVNAHDAPEALFQQSRNELQRVYECLKLPMNGLQEPVSTPLRQEDLLSPEEWMHLVADSVEMIQHGAYKKIVLARGMQVYADTPFSVSMVLQRLRSSYPGAYIFALERGQRYFIGATPERLLRAQDGQIQGMALAGSAPRGTTPLEDARLGADLLRSAKNQEAHAIVAATVRTALAEICSSVWSAEKPQLLRLKNIQHLETPIIGQLHPGHSMLEAIQQLHPTPAVGGMPREAALAAIRQYEQLDRGWYSGPIGWIDVHGNGEFAVALRSGLLNGQTATLFAGCGIVADSQPESEYAESCLKLKVMLRGLGSED